MDDETEALPTVADAFAAADAALRVTFPAIMRRLGSEAVAEQAEAIPAVTDTASARNAGNTLKRLRTSLKPANFPGKYVEASDAFDAVADCVGNAGNVESAGSYQLQTIRYAVRGAESLAETLTESEA